MSCLEDVLDEEDKEPTGGVWNNSSDPLSYCSENVSLVSCFFVTRLYMTLLLNSLGSMFVHEKILGKC